MRKSKSLETTFLQVRDEKAQLNRRVDKLGERLHQRTSQLEELASRLKEFEDGRQAAERRLEAAKHQLEVQEALGPQVPLKPTGKSPHHFFTSWIISTNSSCSTSHPLRPAAPRAWRDSEVSRRVSGH